MLRRLAFAATIFACDASRPVRTPTAPPAPPGPVQLPDLPAPAPIDPRLPVGPLSTVEIPRSTADVADDQTLDPAATQRDIDAFDRALAAYFVPRNAHDRSRLDEHRRRAAFLLQRPHAVGYIKDTLDHLVVECVRTPNATSRCGGFREPVTPSAGSPYSVTVDGRIATVTFRELSDATNPAWRKLTVDLAPTRRAAGIVIDMRSAWGNDPRPIVPWLESLTGRTPLAPLREIHRDRAVAQYVAAYAGRYRDRGRDPNVWSSLVGTPRIVTPRTKQAIAILVGEHCQAACELAARVLATYADAIVLGGRFGAPARLGRDEPALVALPSSGLDVYFYATEYVLASEIEAATGPSDQWDLSSPQELKHDLMTGALRVIDKRLADPSWPPRCDAFPPRALGDLPADATSKLWPPMKIVTGSSVRMDYEYYFRPNACFPGQHRSVTLETKLPFSVLRRFGAKCPEEAQVRILLDEGRYTVWTGPDARDTVSRFARSGLVDKIWGTCEGPMGH